MTVISLFLYNKKNNRVRIFTNDNNIENIFTNINWFETLSKLIFIQIKLIDNLPVAENRPSEQLVHSHGRGKCIKNEELEELTSEKHQKNGRGITYKDVMEKFLCKKKKAQRRLKNAYIEKIDNNGKKAPILFRAFKRTNPQQFYPYSKRANIIEKWKNNKNRPIDPTVAKLYSSPYLEKLKVRYILELLSLLDNQPISIHKLQLKLFVDKNYYDEINIRKITTGNKSKAH